jgi:hypothetical protein
VELVDNEVIKISRTKALVVPWIGIRIADDAVAVWIATQRQLACIGVALKAFSPEADNPKPVWRAVFDVWKKSRPVPVIASDQQVRVIFTRLRI